MIEGQSNKVMLTQNQKEIIDQLKLQFEGMNKAKVSSENPLLEVWDKFNEDKETANHLQMVADAKILALQEKIIADLDKVTDYFDELGYGNFIDFKVSFTGAIGFARLQYSPGVNYHYPIDIYGKIKTYNVKVGPFVVTKDASVYYQLGISDDTFGTIDSLLKSENFKNRANDFFKAVSRLKEYSNY